MSGKALAVAGVAALVIGMAPFSVSVRVGLVLAAIGLVIVWQAIRKSRDRRPVGSVELDDDGVVRRDASGQVKLASGDAPFGVTILADHARTRALIAFTTPEQTRYLHVQSNEPPTTQTDAFFARSAAVADHEVILGAAGNAAGSLEARDAAKLVEAIRARWPRALDRVFLSASDGAAIFVDSNELRVGDRRFDLRAPIEWRGFTFHESIGQVATIYQATWIRQDDAELVLVAPMPAELTSWGAEPRRIWKRTARDERLMQALPDAPPPRELRTAIDRLFMLPLRQALDRAALAKHVTSPVSRRRKDGPRRGFD
jgi:hypothetical protein